MSHDKTTTCSNPAFTPPSRSQLLFKDAGFTLIELIVVAAILAALTLVAIAAYKEIKDVVYKAKATAEVREIERVVIAYSIDRAGAFPDDLSAVGFGGKKDPWGNLYEYRKPPHRTLFGLVNGEFDLYSKGADGGSADALNDVLSLDDIVRAGDGAYVGLAAEF